MPSVEDALVISLCAQIGKTNAHQLVAGSVHTAVDMQKMHTNIIKQTSSS